MCIYMVLYAYGNILILIRFDFFRLCLRLALYCEKSINSLTQNNLQIKCNSFAVITFALMDAYTCICIWTLVLYSRHPHTYTQSSSNHLKLCPHSFKALLLFSPLFHQTNKCIFIICENNTFALISYDASTYRPYEDARVCVCASTSVDRKYAHTNMCAWYSFVGS